MKLSYLIELSNASGGTLYLMAILLLVALLVIIERGWFLYKLMAGGLAVNQRVARFPHHRVDLLKAEVQASAQLPHAQLMAATLSFPDLNQREDLAGRLEETILHEIPKLDRGLWILDTAVTLAPLLGLFGTIVGMFNAFSGLGGGGAVAAQVTSGVAEALIATASGIFIAMVGMIFLNSMNNRVRLLVQQLETLKQMLINRYALDGVSRLTPLSLAKTGS
jgi:biopolymer transport protein ExbB